jgi:hypothetical protein
MSSNIDDTWLTLVGETSNTSKSLSVRTCISRGKETHKTKMDSSLALGKLGSPLLGASYRLSRVSNSTITQHQDQESGSRVLSQQAAKHVNSTAHVGATSAANAKLRKLGNGWVLSLYLDTLCDSVKSDDGNLVIRTKAQLLKEGWQDLLHNNLGPNAHGATPIEQKNRTRSSLVCGHTSSSKSFGGRNVHTQKPAKGAKVKGCSRGRRKRGSAIVGDRFGFLL